ncbi:hypothetical protein [Bradyrhizobium sp. CCBAU 53338]|nr:hypothetical protein [Bradyrhizobium sp. CCBAU 53338]
MPELLEAILWCAALATWLMIFFAIASAGLKPFARSIRRLAAAVFRVKLR